MASGRRGVRLQKAACCRLESGGLQRASERGGSAGCYVTGVVCRRTCALLKSSFVFRDRATYETVFVRSWRKVDVTFCKIWTRSRTNTGPSGCQVQTSRRFSLNRTAANLLKVRGISLPPRKKPRNRTHSYVTVSIYVHRVAQADLQQLHKCSPLRCNLWPQWVFSCFPFFCFNVMFIPANTANRFCESNDSREKHRRAQQVLLSSAVTNTS